MNKFLIFIITLFIFTKLSSQVVIKSYSNPYLTSKGVFNKSDKLTETIVSGITEKEAAKSTTTDFKKFAEPKLVDISPLSKSSHEVFWQ